MKPDCEHEADTHCVHSSERRAFRGCRRRHDWAFRQHWGVSTNAEPLEVGIAFHKAMEEVYNPDTWAKTSDDTKLERAIKVYRDTCEKQRTAFLKATKQTKLTVAEGDNYAERIELGVGMLTHYIREVHPKADKWFTPVAVEVPFSVPLYWPEHPATTQRFAARPGDVMRCYNSGQCGQRHPIGAPVTLNGRVDALLEDNIYGGYLVADWKTAAQLIVNGEFLQLDDQITSYCAALQYTLNIDVRGFLYAEFKKGYPKPPAQLTRLTKGRWYSVKADQDTSYEVAYQTFKELDGDALEAGFYDDYLAALQGPDAPRYHQRFPIIQDDTKLENVMSNVAMEAMDMIDPLILVYPSPSKQNCTRCAYRAPCLGKFNGEDYEYTLKTSFEKRG